MDKVLRLILDRVEGEFCIFQDMETEEMYHYKKNSLPIMAAEGDVIIYEEGTFRFDPELTQSRRKEIKKLMDRLWE